MASRRGKIGISFMCLMLASGLAWFAPAGSVRAQDATETMILNALKSKTSRNPSLGPNQSKEEQQIIDALRQNEVRSLTSRGRDEIAKVIKGKRKIDLQINFDFNSADISPESMSTVMALGRVLSTELAGDVFLVGGHTDAKGSNAYNQRLSERRAETIKRFLVERFRLPTKNLLTAGYGREQLKNRNDPFAAENRRVQVVNLVSNETAEEQ